MKKISFEMWLFVFFEGIWQFIRNIFSWKNKTPFWRVIWLAITICIVIITAMLGYSFYKEYFEYKYRNYYWNSENRIGDIYEFHDRGEGHSRIYNREKGETVLSGLDWIARSEDGDSLIVFAKNHKRGYFNIYTGKIAIPAEYEAAWVFNDGIAAVCVDDSVFFIDHFGKRINNVKIKRNPSQKYIYHGDLIALIDNGRKGLMDKLGKWRVEPIYSGIEAAANNMWEIELKGKHGVLDAEGKLVVPCLYKEASVFKEDGIVVTLDDNSKKRLDYEGNILDEFVFDNVYALEYETDEYNEDGTRKMRPAKMFKYESGMNNYGLMDNNGKPVTPPVYSWISAISDDLYEARIGDAYVKVLLDSHGLKVNK